MKRRRVGDCATAHDLNCRTELFEEGNISKRGTAGVPGTKTPFLAWLSLQLEECSQLTASSCSTFGTYHSNIQAEVILFQGRPTPAHSDRARQGYRTSLLLLSAELFYHASFALELPTGLTETLPDLQTLLGSPCPSLFPPHFTFTRVRLASRSEAFPYSMLLPHLCLLRCEAPISN